MFGAIFEVRVCFLNINLVSLMELRLMFSSVTSLQIFEQVSYK